MRAIGCDKLALRPAFTVFALMELDMATFEYTFTVNTPQSRVVGFHHETSVLKKLTPPPIFVQIHSYEPLEEGSTAEFTLWFGPFPVRWTAVHSNVDDSGLTDTQLRGPLKKWQHSHRFTDLDDNVTQISEEIKYEYEAGIKGLFGRHLFSRPYLYLLFSARKFINRRSPRRAVQDSSGKEYQAVSSKFRDPFAKLS